MRQDWYNLLRKKKNLADLISIKLADSCFYICMEMHYQLKEVLRIWSLTETYFWRFCFLIVRSIERLNYLLRPWSRSEAITTASFKKKKKKKKKKRSYFLKNKKKKKKKKKSSSLIPSNQLANASTSRKKMIF